MILQTEDYQWINIAALDGILREFGPDEIGVDITLLDGTEVSGLLEAITEDSIVLSRFSGDVTMSGAETVPFDDIATVQV